VPGNSVRLASPARILRNSNLRSEHTDRHPVLGFVLDQHRRSSGSREHRTADGADNDDPEFRDQLSAAEGVLH